MFVLCLQKFYVESSLKIIPVIGWATKIKVHFQGKKFWMQRKPQNCEEAAECCCQSIQTLLLCLVGDKVVCSWISQLDDTKFCFEALPSLSFWNEDEVVLATHITQEIGCKC